MSIIMSVFLYGTSWSMGNYPRIEKGSRDDLTGTYTVIYYGGTYLNDPVSVAILDVEGDEYTLEPFDSGYNYVIMNKVSAETALKESKSFVANHSDFYKSSLKRISDDAGHIIGYEVKPLYHITRFGRHDILDVNYWVRDKAVSFTVDIKRNVRRKFRNRDIHFN